MGPTKNKGNTHLVLRQLCHPYSLNWHIIRKRFSTADRILAYLPEDGFVSEKSNQMVLD